VNAEVPATVAKRRTVTLIATFTLPDHSKITVERARVDLIDSAGVVRRTDTQQATVEGHRANASFASGTGLRVPPGDADRVLEQVRTATERARP
jgi:hypothetical protein